MKYKTKLHLKFIFYWVLSILQILFILGISYLSNKWLEMIFTIIGFFTLRKLYEKQFHHKVLLKCATTSLIVMSIVAIVNIPKNISILCSTLMALVITWCSYYVRDYLDLLDLRKAKSIKITKGISVNDLNTIIANVDITETQKEILKLYYCNRMNITKISYKLHYSYYYIVELKTKALDAIEKSIRK